MDNIRIDPREIGTSMRNWVDWSQGRDYWRGFMDAAWILRVPYTMELVLPTAIYTISVN